MPAADLPLLWQNLPTLISRFQVLQWLARVSDTLEAAEQIKLLPPCDCNTSLVASGMLPPVDTRLQLPFRGGPTAAPNQTDQGLQTWHRYILSDLPLIPST